MRCLGRQEGVQIIVNGQASFEGVMQVEGCIFVQ
jgi:hypothetical protein